jgi:hypothetical protein
MRPAGFVILCLLFATCGEDSAPIPLTREAAIDLLLSPAGTEERAPVFIGGLMSEDPVVAEASRAGLTAMGREAAKHLIGAIRSAWNEDDEDSHGSSVIIHYSGDRRTLVTEAGRILSESCTDGACTTRGVVEYVTGDDFSMDRILTLLLELDGSDRARARKSLGVLCKPSSWSVEQEVAPAVLPAMELDQAIAAFHDRDSWAAARAAVTSRGKEAVPTLIDFLRTGSPAEREAAAEGLGLIGGEAALAVPVLHEALDDPERWVRLRSIEALGRIGPAARPAQAKLLACVAGEGGEARVFAATALTAIGPEPDLALPVLKRAVLTHDEDLHFLPEAFRAIATLRRR